MGDITDITGKAFDADEHEKMREFDALPPDWYLAGINDAQLKQARSGKGTYLAVTFEILDGEYRGRKLWANMNIRHDSETAQRIGQQELATLSVAVGIHRLEDSAELNGKTLYIRVTAKPNKDSGEIENEVKGYKPSDGAAPTEPANAAAKPTPATKPAATAPATAGAKKKMPWDK